MYNLVIFSNCHGERYLEIFKRESNIHDYFNIKFILSYQHLNDFENFKKYFEKADILIINNIKNYNDYTINNLKRILKKDVLLIILPFIRFEGYYLPEKYKQLKYFKENSVSYFPNINLNQIDLYLDQKINIFEYIKYYNKCLEKLKQIERESDIKFIDFFINNHLTYPMFRDNYHPTSNMIEFVASQLMIKIQEKFDIEYTNNVPKLVTDAFEYGHYKPIQNYIKKVLGIKYDLDEVFICSRKKYLTKIIEYENNVNKNITDLTDMKNLF